MRSPSAGRLVDVAKAHLVVLPVPAIGPCIARGELRIDGRIGRIDDRVQVGQQLTVATAEAGFVPEALPLTIERETAEYLVVDKPAGTHVHPLGPHRTGTLLNALLHHAGARDDQPWAAWRPHPMHRLDRAASGLVAIAKSAAAHTALRIVEHRYRATVIGRMVDDRGTIAGPLDRDPQCDYRRAIVAGGQPAVTHFTVVRREASTTIVELELETGRTHQIRAHLASIGHPIVGDTLYTSAMQPSTAIELRSVALRLDYSPPWVSR